MKTRDSAQRRFVAPLLVLLLAGCASDDVYFEPNMDFGSLQTVAILPFQNLSGKEEAGERLRNTFMSMLLATGAVYVLPPGEVARGLGKVSRMPPAGPSTEQIKELGGILGVDALITGVVKEYGSVRSGATSANVISLSLQMVEVGDGLVVWSASSTKGGVGLRDRLLGGGGEPMDSVSVRAVNELLDKLFQ